VISGKHVDRRFRRREHLHDLVDQPILNQVVLEEIACDDDRVYYRFVGGRDHRTACGQASGSHAVSDRRYVNRLEPDLPICSVKKVRHMVPLAGIMHERTRSGNLARPGSQ